MARFTNYATLSYSGGTTDSNIVTGELLQTLTLTKTAVDSGYEDGSTVAYVVTVVNSGTEAVTGLTLTDDLGGYTFGSGMVYPLEYVTGTLRSYVNGILQTAPTTTGGPPLTITGLTVPAGGNALLVYETSVTDYAPMGVEATITNTVSLTGGTLTTALTAQAVVGMTPRANLRISKALCPATVMENSQLTYTFVITNDGAIPATTSDQVRLTDTFNPVLRGLTVTLDGAVLTEGVDYAYNATTGVFTTVPGRITVPAATYAQNTDGTWTATPGTGVLVITGTV